MSGDDVRNWVTLIAAAGGAVGGVVAAIQAKQAQQKVQAIQITIDGRMEELLRMAHSSSMAEGQLKGAADEQARVNAQKPDAPAITQINGTPKEK